MEPRELARKPTPASLLSWSTSSYKGEPAYTNGYLIDVGGGEPHIKDWVNCRNVLRPTVTEDRLTRLVEQSLSKSHDPVKLVATFERATGPARLPCMSASLANRWWCWMPTMCATS